MPEFLHAAHQVRASLDRLELVSWLVIGFGVGALALAGGSIVRWLRTPEAAAPAVRAWGQDDTGWYFELSNAGDARWSVETSDGRLLPLERDAEGLLRTTPCDARPEALVAAPDMRLTL